MTNSPDHLLSEQDLLNAALVDAGELKPCPLCRGKALSGGERNPTTGNEVYRIFCNASRGLVPTCGLSLSICLGKEDTAETARAEAVRRWNQRPAEDDNEKLRREMAQLRSDYDELNDKYSCV